MDSKLEQARNYEEVYGPIPDSDRPHSVVARVG